MSRMLYDLAGADPALRFSPYCWRIKLALAHKGLDYETTAWRFTEKDVIAFSGQTKVPVLVDHDVVVHDSAAIADYLDRQYPDAPPLFGDTAACALTHFIQKWAEETLHPAIVKIVLPDIFKILDPKDQPYFRETRERFQGKTIEALAAERATHLPVLEAVLKPLRATLAGQKFLAGDSPAWADHIVFGALQWARLTSSTPLWPADDVVAHWMDAVLAAYGLV
jgi:glutathione S-transferase